MNLPVVQEEIKLTKVTENDWIARHEGKVIGHVTYTDSGFFFGYTAIGSNGQQYTCLRTLKEAKACLISVPQVNLAREDNKRWIEEQIESGFDYFPEFDY